MRLSARGFPQKKDRLPFEKSATYARDKFLSQPQQEYTMSPGCTQCGGCCRKYGMRLEASPLDIARWTLGGRPDILARVGVEYDEKGEVAGGRLWVDEGGHPASACPFYFEAAGKSCCGIHDAKPEVCEKHYCVQYYDSLT